MNLLTGASLLALAKSIYYSDHDPCIGDFVIGTTKVTKIRKEREHLADFPFK